MSQQSKSPLSFIIIGAVLIAVGVFVFSNNSAPEEGSLQQAASEAGKALDEAANDISTAAGNAAEKSAEVLERAADETAATIEGSTESQQ